MKKKDINLIQIFPDDKSSKKYLQEKKMRWLIEILREKYPDDIVVESIKAIVKNEKPITSK